MWLTYKVTSDPVSILRGGNFSENPVEFMSYPMLDVLAHGIKNQLPYWTCVHGGVQVWLSSIYVPLKEDSATFVVHMNSPVGGGHIVSAPMYTPRKNAEYVVSMSVVCNPHGGPRNQSLLPIVFDAKGNKMEPYPDPIIVTLNPNSSASSLAWERRSFKMLGTGDIMFLYLLSLVKGNFGLLLANVQVRLSNLLENGSFEDLGYGQTFNTLTDDVVLVGPRAHYVPHWDIESGKVKIIKTGYDNAYQAATDNGHYLMELNAAETAGEISTVFEVPVSNVSTVKNFEYVMLVDTAANPKQPELQTAVLNGSESASIVLGMLEIKITGVESSKELLKDTLEINTTGFTTSSVGWVTKKYTFNMENDQKAKLSFKSLASRNSYGPFVDNVVVYEVMDKSRWINSNVLSESSAEISNKLVFSSVIILVTNIVVLLLLFSTH